MYENIISLSLTENLHHVQQDSSPELSRQNHFCLSAILFKTVSSKLRRSRRRYPEGFKAVFYTKFYSVDMFIGKSKIGEFLRLLICCSQLLKWMLKTVTWAGGHFPAEIPTNIESIIISFCVYY